ncbi:hypothetical protein GCK32_015360 [Trichostrongylus colubriformis]|uniref:Uncharacterized protein n=1 Tax=Trichostrongylus colubriformis TaxID=6319 RepID=A0AAN8IU43_TRICO
MSYQAVALVALFIAYLAVANRLAPPDVPSDETLRRDAYRSGFNTTDTSADDQNDDEKGSWLDTGVITEMITGAFDWLVNAFVGLIANRMERNSTESYEGSIIA